MVVQRHGTADTGNEGKFPPIIVALAASYAFPALMVTWVVDLVLGRPLGINDRNSVNASEIDLFVASTFSINRPTFLPRNRYDAHSTIGDMQLSSHFTHVTHHALIIRVSTLPCDRVLYETVTSKNVF